MVDTVSITTDAFVSSASATTNYGTNESLLISGSSTIYYTLFDWDISSIDMKDVVDIDVKLYGFSYPSGVDCTATTHMITSTWDESTVTFNTMPTYSTTVHDTITYDTDVPQWYTIDILGINGQFYDGVYTQYGLLIDSDGAGISSFRSSDYTTSAYRPYVEITYIDDYGYYVDMYTGLVYNTITLYITGNARIEQGAIEQVGDYTSILSVRTPWGTSYEDSEYLEVGETLTYSQSITGGTEYFKVKYDSTYYDGEIGYYPIYYIEWYREYNNRYVKTDGEDDDTGRAWDNSYATIEKGFAETPSGGNLYIENGIYSETLENLTLASGNTSITIHPTNESHVSTDYAAIAIGTGTVTDLGATISNSSSIISGLSYLTIIDTQHTIPANTNIQLFDVSLVSASSSVLQVRLVSYNLSGTVYTPVHIGEWSPDISVSGTTSVSMMYTGVDVDEYDSIGLQIKYISGATQFGWRKYYTGTVDEYLWTSNNEMNGSLDTTSVDTEFTGYRTSMVVHYFV